MNCASLCSGDLIAFCDQDDIWDDIKLAALVRQFSESEIDLAYHDFRLMAADGSLITTMPYSLFSDPADPWAVSRGLTLAFRRKLLKYSDLWALSVDHFKPTERMAHDQWFTFLAHSFNSLEYIPQKLLSYRQHEANLYGIPGLSLSPQNAQKTNLTVIGYAIFGYPDMAQARGLSFNKRLTDYGLASLSRLRVLTEIHQRETGIVSAGLVKHIEYYRFTGNSYTSRSSIYGTKPPLEKIKSLIRAIRSRSYKLSRRGLKDVLLDIIFGILVSSAKRTPSDIRNANALR
jgi:hypothetical protein